MYKIAIESASKQYEKELCLEEREHTGARIDGYLESVDDLIMRGIAVSNKQELTKIAAVGAIAAALLFIKESLDTEKISREKEVKNVRKLTWKERLTGYIIEEDKA